MNSEKCFVWEVSNLISVSLLNFEKLFQICSNFHLVKALKLKFVTIRALNLGLRRQRLS